MNPFPWIIVNLIALAFALYQGYHYGAQSVQIKWDTEKAAVVTAQREKEATLQANMDKLREEKNRETARLSATVRTLTNSLRNRPERPAVPEVAASGAGASGCTGSTLYRSDSEFLVRLSERADTIRLALKECQKAYKEASGQ